MQIKCKQMLQDFEKVFFIQAISVNKNTLYKSKGYQKFKGRFKNKNKTLKFVDNNLTN